MKSLLINGQELKVFYFFNTMYEFGGLNGIDGALETLKKEDKEFVKVYSSLKK
jgi:hypothetical protein